MLADELQRAGDQFEGYTTTRVTGVPVLVLFDEQRQPAASLAAGQTGYVAIARTPFYLEAGGQVSDSGRIYNEAGDASATVEGTCPHPAGTAPRASCARRHQERCASAIW